MSPGTEVNKKNLKSTNSCFLSQTFAVLWENFHLLQYFFLSIFVERLLLLLFVITHLLFTHIITYHATTSNHYHNPRFLFHILSPCHKNHPVYHLTASAAATHQASKKASSKVKYMSMWICVYVCAGNGNSNSNNNNSTQFLFLRLLFIDFPIAVFFFNIFCCWIFSTYIFCWWLRCRWVGVKRDSFYTVSCFMLYVAVLYVFFSFPFVLQQKGVGRRWMVRHN